MSNEPSITELQAKIAELEARNKALSEALAPFAELADGFGFNDLEYASVSEYEEVLQATRILYMQREWDEPSLTDVSIYECKIAKNVLEG